MHESWHCMMTHPCIHRTLHSCLIDTPCSTCVYLIICTIIQCIYIIHYMQLCSEDSDGDGDGGGGGGDGGGMELS